MSLELVISKLNNPKKLNDSKYQAFCPSHNDRKKRSLSVSEENGTILLKCFTGCSFDAIVKALGLEQSNMFAKTQKSENKQSKIKSTEKPTLATFAEKKCLPAEFLETCGVKDSAAGLVFLYLNQDGEPSRYKVRHGQTAQDSFWQKDSTLPITAYGSHLLKIVRERKINHLQIVEGESDTLTLLFHNIIGLGIPGASMTKKLEAFHLEGINTLYLHQEPDHAGANFIRDLKKRLQEFNYQGQAFAIQFPGNGIKDVNDLHCYCHKNNLDFKTEFQKLIDSAVPLNLDETEISSTSSTSPTGTKSETFETGTNISATNQAGDLITPDIWVRALDRDNYGKVISVNPSSKTASVFFKSPKGHTANRTLSIDLLAPIHESNVPTQYLDKAKPFKLISAKELLEQPAPEWLVDNIFLEKSVVFLYGQSGVGKSFVGLDLSLAITTGIKWQNREVKAGAVIYVAAEGSSGIGKRLKAWLEHYKQESLPENLYFITVPANLMHEQITDSLVNSIKEVCPNPKMIVLDTFARSLVGGDENSAKDTGLFIAGVDRLKEETGSTILVLHHTQKSNSAVERGSSAIRGSADTMIVVQQEGDHGRTAFSLKCDKMKDSEPFETLQFQLLPVLDSCVPVLTAFVPKVERISDNILLALKVLSSFVSTEGATNQKWQEVLKNKGMSRSAFYRTLKVLVDEVEEGQPKYVKCINKRYFLTDEGKTFLGLQKNDASFISPTSSNLVPGTNGTKNISESTLSPTSPKSIYKYTLGLDGTETETKKETTEIKNQNIDLSSLNTIYSAVPISVNPFEENQISDNVGSQSTEQPNIDLTNEVESTPIENPSVTNAPTKVAATKVMSNELLFPFISTSSMFAIPSLRKSLITLQSAMNDPKFKNHKMYSRCQGIFKELNETNGIIDNLLGTDIMRVVAQVNNLT